jgi:hypothetical protein
VATLTFSLTSAPFTGSKSYTLSDADVQRWLDALEVWHSNSLPATPTNAQLLLAWADAVVVDSKRIVRDIEARQAAAAITDISAS